MKLTMEGARLVPYHLDRLVAAKQQANGHPPKVFICEGEKDADRVAEGGFLASTNPRGAGNWRAEYNQYFAGFEVVILPDNDKTGRDHAQHVAANVLSVAASVRILTFRDLPEKGDVSDWIDRGGTPAALTTLVEQTPLWAPPDNQPREIVYVAGGELPHVIDDAEAALIKCDAEIFEHNTQPTYLGREAPPANQIVANPRRLPFAYGADHLADQWTRFVDFQKYDAHSRKWVSINCPDYVAQAYLQRRGRRHLKPLRGVISTPTLRADGSILDTPGYDTETKCFP